MAFGNWRLAKLRTISAKQKDAMCIGISSLSCRFEVLKPKNPSP